MTGFSHLDRRQYTEAGGIIEYEKREDDRFVWSWNWTNDLMRQFFAASQQIGYCQVYDASAAEYRDITERTWQDFTEMAVWPATTQATDAIYFLNLAQFEAFEIDAPSTPAVYTGDVATWEYWNGTAWTALTLLRDETDTTAFDGKRPFQGGGEITFNAPANWATCDFTIKGSTVSCYAIRVRPTTVANLTTVAVLAYVECSEFASSAAYVDSGVSRLATTLDDNVTSAVVTGLGEFECTITSSLGRMVQQVFRFAAPEESPTDDYGNR